MNPKDKQTSRPADASGIAAPSPSDAAPPQRDKADEASATKLDPPTAKSMAAGKQPPADTEVAAPPMPPAPGAPEAATWSPPYFPSLVFRWSVIRTDDPAVLIFPTQVSFYTTVQQLDAAASDPQSLVVEASLSSDRKRVTFSVSEGSGRSPFLSGTLNYEPGSVMASLTVTSLKYPGGAVARQVLYP